MPRRNRRTEIQPIRTAVTPDGRFAFERALRIAEKDRHRARRNRAMRDRAKAA